MQDELGFPDKADPRRGWTPAELNSILRNHVVRNQDGCTLMAFGCVEWESELYRGVMRVSMEDAQALFSQNEPSGYPKLYLIKHIYCGVSWDIPV